MITDRAVRFEGCEHDSPTWIDCERTGPDSRIANIGGDVGVIHFGYEC